MSKKSGEFGLDKLAKNWKKKKTTLPRQMGTIAVNHFKGSFRKQGFTDKTTKAWKERKFKESGKAILVQSGYLRRSIRIKTATANKIIVGTAGPRYARIHNEGGVTKPRVTNKMRKFGWARYKETGNPLFKGIATTKKTRLTVNIPQRQFIGNSEVMNKKIIRKLLRELADLPK